MHPAKSDDPSRKESAYSVNSEVQRKARATKASFKRPAYWVMAFGWSLSVCAGLVNVVAMQVWGTFVSHVTGSTTNIGLSIEGYFEGRSEIEKLWKALVLLGSFMAGAFSCGLLIDKNQVHLGGKASYGYALVFNGVLLAAATALTLSVDDLSPGVKRSAACMAAMACGLQNAMCTSHFGAVVRTTHVTGTVTDVGSTLGRISSLHLRRICSGRRRLNPLERAEMVVDGRKLLVLAPMWCSFVCGCIAGAYLGTRFGVLALLVPASFTFSMGLFYLFLRARLKLFLKSVLQDRLNVSLEDCEKTLGRTKHTLNEYRKSQSNLSALASVPSNPSMFDGSIDMEELESEVEHMLEKIHQVEDDLEALHAQEALLRMGTTGSAYDQRCSSQDEEWFGGPDDTKRPIDKSHKSKKPGSSGRAEKNFVGVVTCAPGRAGGQCGPGSVPQCGPNFALPALCGGSR